jgi:chitin synthase
MYVVQFRNVSKFTEETLFFYKKWAYIISLMVINIAGCVLVYYTRDLQVILYIILVLKSKDIIMSVMFTFNMIYKSIFKTKTLPSCESTDETEYIIAFVPTYKESIEQVCRTVDSLIANKLGSQYLMTCIVSDGETNYEMLFETQNLVRGGVYKSWKGEEVSIKINYGTRKNKHIMLITKDKNQGKKDSIIVFNDIFNISRENMDLSNKVLREAVTNDISNVFGVEYFDYIFATDGDTVISDTSLVCLVDSIKTRDAVASCGIVNVDNSQGNPFWNNLQNFQYLYGQYMRRTNEDVFNQVLCLPGCISMFKINENAASAMKLYSELPDKTNLVMSSVQFVGTDRRYTSSLVYTNDQARIVLDDRSHAYTVPPDNLKSYVAQRKRWCQNMYFNTMINIIGANINFVLRFFNLIDFLRLSLIYFRLFNTIYFIYLLASSYTEQLLNIVPYIVILLYPIVCFFVYSLFNSHLRSQYFNLFVSLIINRIFSLFSTVVVFTVMLWNIGNDSWNNNTSEMTEQEGTLELENVVDV